jgi:hypothetical protein
MRSVFISYKREDDAHIARVRSFADSLRLSAEQLGIAVILDQYVDEAKSGGPGEGWEIWSENQAMLATAVLPVASVQPATPARDGARYHSGGLDHPGSR